ncbi:MAG: hypothetical protein KGS72_01685 [Cyanobacteria bacterium REEB67]|nr:hypothetical protein [Cyanobacteria bacterium REEB67]
MKEDSTQLKTQPPTKVAGRKSYIKKAAALLFGFCVGIACTGEAQAKDYYLSPTGSGGPGTSWASAFTSFQYASAVQYQPGDRLLIDGGAKSITYPVMTVTMFASGVPGNPVTITNSTEAGRNGQVIISGKQTNGQPNAPVALYWYGNNLNLVGSHRDAIKISDYSTAGLYVAGNSDLFQNIEIANVAVNTSGQGRTGTGLLFGGTNNRYQSLDIHGCAQIAQQKPTEPSEVAENSTFGGCWFFDTVQRGGKGVVTSGQNASSQVLFSNCAFGPGLATALNCQSVVGTVHSHGCLFLNATAANIVMSAASTSKPNLVIERATSFMTPTNQNNLAHSCLNTNGSGTTSVSTSVFWGGTVRVPAAVPVKVAKNDQYLVKGNTHVLAPGLVDPLFQDETIISAFTGANPLGTIATTNYSLAANSPATGNGAVVVSVLQLNKNAAKFFNP